MSLDHIDHQDYYYHKARHAELLRMSGTASLVDQVRQNRKPGRSISRHVLGWLGQHLIAWGERLQECYGNNSEAPNLDSSHVSW